MLRAAPPAVGSASNTSTPKPACAKTMAAAKPFGPAPTTHALRLISRRSAFHLMMAYPRDLHRLLARFDLRHLDGADLAVGRALQRRSVQAAHLPAPPRPGKLFLSRRGEPVLPEYGPNLSWRSMRKRIAGKQCEHVFILIARQQAHLSIEH